MAKRRTSTPNYTVAFDFGGVLSSNYDPLPVIHAETGGELTAVSEAYWQHRLAFDQGQLSQDEYWKLILQAAGIADPSAEEISELQEVDNHYWGTLHKDARELIHDLARNSVRMVLLSNTNLSFGQYLREQEWFEAFQFALISAEEGVSKPQSEIFEILLQALAHETGGVVRAGEVIFFDDSAANVEAAKKLGINAHLWPRNSSELAVKPGWEVAREVLHELNIALD